jgi:hypothetical protein
MMGWKLFVRAVTLLIENLGEALRVSAVPYLVVIGASILLSGGAPESALVLPDPTTEDPSGAATAQMAEAASSALLIGILNLIVTLWVAVAWHRYVLLAEQPSGWLPAFHGPEMLGYLGRSILIGLIVGVAILGIAIPLGALAVGIPPLTPLVPLVGGFIGALLFYRLGVVLPARAVGRKMPLGEAMEATRGHTGTVAALAALTLAFTLLLQVPTILDGGTGPVTALYQGVVGWIGLMVGVSTLTALYGVVIEGRPVE